MQISVFTSDDALSKTFRRGPGGVEKIPGGKLVRGWVEHKRFLDLGGFSEFISGLNGANALAYGVSKHARARVLSRNEIGSEKGGDYPIITRTRCEFAWPEGEGVMMLDHDVRKDRDEPLTPDQLLNSIIVVCPDLVDAPMLLTHSTSSYIYNGDKLVSGAKGMKVYIHVKDARDIPRAGMALFKRLWMSGRGYIEIGQNGRMQNKTLIDASVWKPEGLDFAGGAHCVPPIRQDRPDHILMNADFEAEPFDTTLIKDLSEDEERRYQDIIKSARKLMEQEAQRRRTEWLASLPEDQRDIAEAASLAGILPADFVLTSMDGEEFTVRDALLSKEKYHGIYVRHPFEPDYQDNEKLAQIKLDHNPKPCVHTFAHGGETFWLDTAEVAFEEVECPEPELSDIERLNKEFAVAVIGAKTFILQETKDDVAPLRKSDFETLLQNQRKWIEVADKPKCVPLSKIWLESPERRHVQGICFSPKGCKDGWINLWRGFAVDPSGSDAEEAAKKCALYRKHVEQVICNNDPTHIKYVWAWLADLVQNPGGRKPGVALVLRGGRGTGKGMFSRPLMQIVGRHGIQLNNREHLTGRFNHHLADKILVFLDEAFWAGDKKSEGVLKGLITEPRIAVERKGVDTYPVDSYVRCIMASNEDWVVPAGPDERRFLVLDVADTHKQDSTGYFKALANEIDTGGTEALLMWLLAYDGSEIDLFHAPESNARLDQKRESLEPVHAWWLECLYKGVVYDHEWPEFLVPRLALYAYKEWARSWPGNTYISSEKLARKIYGAKGVCPGFRSKSNVDDGVENGYRMPSLAEARKRFETFLGGAVEWERFDEL